MEFENIIYKVDGGIATIQLNRPKALNALNSDINHDIMEAIKLVQADESVRVLIMTGSERAFAAGADVKEMAEATIKMVTDAIDSFVRQDLPLAHQVMEYDNVVDELFNKVKKELIQLIGEHRESGEFCIDLLMVAKYFERIGDHAVNVAEWVQYSLTGKKESA